jgi:hypothetical protein
MGSSVVSATSTPKSQKIADPEQLSDGKEGPKFEGWLLAMERKLTVNADRFPNLPSTARLPTS